MTFKLDPNLEQYATEKQWAKLQEIERHGSDRAAADATGRHRKMFYDARMRVMRKAALAGYAPEHDLTRTVPDGYRVRGVSTYYNKEGDASGQWVKSEIDKDRQHEAFLQVVEELTTDIKPLPLIPAPDPNFVRDDIMACYPVGDHHLGMLSWNEETGGDYDITIGEKLLQGATDYLVGSVPSASHGTVVFLGDFMHYDSFAPVTPTSRNQLDTDTRFPKLVRAAIRSMRYMIERAAEVHENVHVIVEIGNHDLASSIFLMECLRNVYEENPRITIDTSPAHYHYFRFGNVLVGTHHGHGTKMANLPLIMAADRAEDWGDTKHRYWWTGHIHTSKVQPATSSNDFSGVVVESFRVLPPDDAWANQKGYRPIRDMKAIVLHKKYGEVVRLTVNPNMIEESE